jgi:hypothetical protein
MNQLWHWNTGFQHTLNHQFTASNINYSIHTALGLLFENFEKCICWELAGFRHAPPFPISKKSYLPQGMD